MKKIILIPAFILGATVYAQKGSWYLGGNAGGSMGDTRKYGNTSQKRSNWNISPEVGTFLTNHLQVGLGANFGQTYLWGGSQLRSKMTGMGGNAHLRYLFGERNFKPFLGVSFSYGTGKTSEWDYLWDNGTTTKVALPEVKQQTLNASITAGFFYDLSPRISLYGSMNVLGYNQQKYNGAISRDIGFNASSNLSSRFSVGIYYTFKKGKATE